MTNYGATINDKAGVMTILGSVVSIFSGHIGKINQWEDVTQVTFSLIG